MKRLKHIKELNEQALPMKEWLPADFDFRDYVEKNMPGMARRIITNRDIDHVSRNLELLAKAYSGEETREDFIESLLTERLDKALMNADDVNRIMIWTYVVFQINKVPIVLREKYRK